eukprot:365309-Chlamydomonas_euryale.AAC.15
MRKPWPWVMPHMATTPASSSNHAEARTSKGDGLSEAQHKAKKHQGSVGVLFMQACMCMHNKRLWQVVQGNQPGLTDSACACMHVRGNASMLKAGTLVHVCSILTVETMPANPSFVKERRATSRVMVVESVLTLADKTLLDFHDCTVQFSVAGLRRTGSNQGEDHACPPVTPSTFNHTSMSNTIITEMATSMEHVKPQGQ